MGTPEMRTSTSMSGQLKKPKEDNSKINGDSPDLSLNISAIDNNSKKNSIGKSSFFNNIRPKSARSTGKDDINASPKSTPIKDDKRERELKRLKEREEKKEKKEREKKQKADKKKLIGQLQSNIFLY